MGNLCRRSGCGDVAGEGGRTPSTVFGAEPNMWGRKGPWIVDAL